MTDTAGYVLNHTMLRVKDAEATVAFYRDVLGMTLLDRFDIEMGKFSLYFMGYPEGDIPTDPPARVKWVFEQRGLVEFTHNWGTEADPDFSYHDGNAEPRGFGHICVSVPDVAAACDRFETLGVTFQKRPADGVMKGVAFIKDPDGYWIEIVSGGNLSALMTAVRAMSA